MNKLEKKLVKCDWWLIRGAFTTMYKGFGFVIYNVAEKMYLAGLSRQVTIDCLEAHNPNPPRLVSY